MYTLAVGTLGCIADVKCCLVNKVLSVDYHNLVVFFKSLIIACTSVLAG